MTFLTKFHSIHLVSEQILDLYLWWHLVPVYLQSLYLYMCIVLHRTDKPDFTVHTVFVEVYVSTSGQVLCYLMYGRCIAKKVCKTDIKMAKSRVKNSKLPGHILFHMHIILNLPKLWYFLPFQWLSMQAWALFFNDKCAYTHTHACMHNQHIKN